MGNRNPPPPAHELSQEWKSSPLKPDRSVEDAARDESLYQCCGIRFDKRRRQEEWRVQFEENCDSILDDYQWVKPVLEAYRSHRSKSRADYAKEVEYLRIDFENKAKTPASCILEPVRQQQLKQMLRESVILPSAVSPRASAVPPAVRMSNLQRRQLTGKTSLAFPVAKSPSSSQLSKPNLRMPKASMMSFIDERMGQLYKTKESVVDKDSALSLSLFVVLTELIEKHSEDPNCVLSKVKQAFVQYLTDREEDDEQTMTSDLQMFIKLYKHLICDFYLLENVVSIIPNQELLSDDNITNSVASMLFKCPAVYSKVFNTYVRTDRKRQEELKTIYEKHKYVRPEDLEIKEQYCLNKRTVDWYLNRLSMDSAIENVSISEITEYEPYESCVQRLRQIGEVRTPIAKLKVIMSCAEKLTENICSYYKENNIDVGEALIDADQVLTIFSYIVLRSREELLVSHLKIVGNFSSENQLMSQTGYYYSVLQSALDNLFYQEDLKSAPSFGPIHKGE